LTSILSAPGIVPESGATDWTIHSCGSSKLRFFEGSVKTFQADAVEPGAADPPPEAAASVVVPGEEPGEAPDDDASGVVVPAGPLPAVHAGVPFPSPLQPLSAAAATPSAAAIRIPRDSAVPVILPA
jgi:hypothetical protein